LEALAITAGHAPGAADAMIAGTARRHDLTVITKNLKHFQTFGIPVLTPEQAAG
jgi:toxin FitB